MARGRKTWFKQKERICVTCRKTIRDQRMYWFRYQVQVTGSLIDPEFEEWDFYNCRDCGPEIKLVLSHSGHTVQKCAGYLHCRFSLYDLRLL